MYPVLCNHDVACRHTFPSVEEQVSTLSSPLASAAHIPTSHNIVKVLWLYDLPVPTPCFLTTLEHVGPNWLILRKYWCTSKSNGNKSILKACSMLYNSIGYNKICEFPCWPPFSCYEVSHCSFSQERSPFIQACEQEQMNKTGDIQWVCAELLLWSLFKGYNLLTGSTLWSLDC